MNPAAPADERARLILDAAAGLLLRWGYRRVTIADVAVEANVGTGTIYLSWKTKEALFEAVLLREVIAVWQALLDRMRADAAEALLHRWLRSLFIVIRQRPLALALFTRNPELLGKLANSPVMRLGQQRPNGHELITLLRSLGLMRTDTSIGVQVYAFSAVVTGFSFVDPFLSQDDQVTLEEQAEAIAMTVRLAFEPAVPPTPTELRERVAPALIDMLDRAIAACEHELQARMAPT